MRRVFQQDELQTEIEEKGYVVIPNFLNQGQIDGLRKTYEEQHQQKDAAFKMSNWDEEKGPRKKIHDTIADFITPYANRYLKEYRPVLGCFAVKMPGENSQMVLHQDWTLVDEDQYTSVSFWVPLVETKFENGAIQVLDKSNHYAGMPRGRNIPVPFEDIDELIRTKHLKTLEMKAGDALVFDHRLIHASPPNQTDRVRMVAVLAMIPEDAQLLHYGMDKEGPQNELEVLEMPDDFLVGHNYFNYDVKPDYKSEVGVKPYEFKAITEETILGYQD